MAETLIEWAEYTWNPWRGCTKVSPGCANCYAETLSARNHATLGLWGPMGTRVVGAESYWASLQKWDRSAAKEGRRKRVFCSSMADLFERWMGCMTATDGRQLWATADNWTTEPGGRTLSMDDVRLRAFNAMLSTLWLDYLLLTKRPENVKPLVHRWAESMGLRDWKDGFISPHVWIGTSIENQEAAEARIPNLLRIAAGGRFLSVEPLIGPVNLREWLVLGWCDKCKAECFRERGRCRGCDSRANPGIDWVIVGGESGGNKARRCDLDWIRKVVADCREFGVPVMVKQLGTYPTGETWSTVNRVPLPTLDVHSRPSEPYWLLHHPKGEDPNEWPPELRVQEIPSNLRRPIG